MIKLTSFINKNGKIKGEVTFLYYTKTHDLMWFGVVFAVVFSICLDLTKVKMIQFQNVMLLHAC